LHPPGYFRLLASLFYETLLLLALLFVATFLFVMLLGEATHPPLRYLLQLYLWVVSGLYLCWCWSRGRTLAMQAWKMRLVRATGGSLTFALALRRYLLATFGLVLAGIGFWWALLDREHRYLHDRLIGTRLIMENRTASR
jgi:uncharacterized RDD family membrane protein YckC